MAAENVVAIGRAYRSSVLAWLHLVRVFNRISRDEYQLLATFGLTAAQFDVLTHLATLPGMSQQDLADRLLVTKGNVCGLVDRLEAAGLVERLPNPDDRRAHRLHLTPAGQLAFEAAAPELEAMVADRFSALNGREQGVLLGLLARLDRVLRRAA